MWSTDRQGELHTLKELLEAVEAAGDDPKALARAKRLAAHLQTPGQGKSTSFVDYLQACADAPNAYLSQEGAASFFGEGAHCGGTQFAYQKEPHRMFDVPVSLVQA